MNARVRTSRSHPLRIDEIALPFLRGRIGLTLCPGKRGESLLGARWERDLAVDLKTIGSWGASLVVTLMEDHELQQLGVAEFPTMARTEGLAWIHLPIVDVSIPNEAWINAWRNEYGPALRQALLQGSSVLLHCRGGLGRTGLVAALLLIDLGLENQQAIDLVRTARPGAIETRQQEAFVKSYKSWAGRQTLDYFAGCLLGGAVGDALGWPVEFDGWGDIQDRFGLAGVTGPIFNSQGVMEVSDDTQMTLFTAEGLLLGRLAGSGSPALFTAHGYRAYLRWLHTQGDLNSKDRNPALEEGWLHKHQELFARRAPGGTCLSALGSGTMGTLQNPINDSKGCGTVMRMAPIGLFAKSPGGLTPMGNGEADQLTFRIGCEFSAITHGHPSGYLAGGVLALLISRLIAGDVLEGALDVCETEVSRHAGHEECLALVRKARELGRAEGNVPSPAILASIGEGWVAEEALAIGIYCALSYPDDFGKAVLLAVNHGGDSDSTGAIAGNIMGALVGRRGIPEDWLQDLELKPLLEAMAQNLFVGACSPQNVKGVM